ncbi:MAG: hypothetical protein PHY93_13780 [Bacteriovorax sp.]|nr:hypothetical protein [Bacteriovorax sp.]
MEHGPWTTPKIMLAFSGLGLLFTSQTFSAKSFHFPTQNFSSETWLLFLLACVFLIIQCIFLNFPWNENLAVFAVFLSVGIIDLTKVKENDVSEEYVFMLFLNCIFALQAVATIVQFIFFEHFKFTMMGSGLKWRSLGLIGNPNQLALYLSLFFLRPIKHWWSPRYGKILTATVTLALILTFSRGVYLALFFASIYFLKNKVKKSVAVALFAMAIIFTIEISWKKTGVLNLDSLTGRAHSFQLFFNEYVFNFLKMLIGDGRFEINAPLHNQYLYLFKHVGLIGLLLFVFILMSFLKRNTPLVVLIAIFSIYDLPLLNLAFVFTSLLYFLYLPKLIYLSKLKPALGLNIHDLIGPE